MKTANDKKPWVEGSRYVKKIMLRTPHGDGEYVHLDCGHRWFVPVVARGATAYKCRFCVREDTGYNPPEDPTPPKIPLTHGWTAESAANWLACVVAGASASAILADCEAYRRAFREAAKQFHPDTGARNTEQWHALQKAQAFLDSLHALI